ncbi:MAG TPA: hypothetical protein VF077_12610 [Nitrospiraceae bacterium]
MDGPTVTRRRRKGTTSGVQVRGFFRVRLVEQDGRISGDSGWFENTVVNLGKRDYLCTPLAGGAAKSIARMALGTGTAPAVTDTALQGELSHQTNAASGTRNRFTVNTSQIGSTAIEFQATFASSVSFATTTANISNIMVINDTTVGGTIFAGNTFASSLLNTNQDVQASYRITFT